MAYDQFEHDPMTRFHLNRSGCYPTSLSPRLPPLANILRSISSSSDSNHIPADYHHHHLLKQPEIGRSSSSTDLKPIGCLPERHARKCSRPQGAVLRPQTLVPHRGVIPQPHHQAGLISSLDGARDRGSTTRLGDLLAQPLDPTQLALIRQEDPDLFKSLSPEALRSFIRHILTSRFDALAQNLIEDLKQPQSLFSVAQRRSVFHTLIDLCRTKRRWLSPDAKSLGLVSDTSVAEYFASMLELLGPVADLGLGPDNIRCVMRALRRTSHPLFWDAQLMGQLWRSMIRDQASRNQLEANSRLAIRSIIHWTRLDSITNHPASQQAIWSLLLEIWSQLIEWGQIIKEDLPSGLENETGQIPPSDQAALTVLGSIICAANRLYLAEPLNRNNHKLFKNACEALETLLQRPQLAVTLVAERLVGALVKIFLNALQTDHRAPAPAVMAIFLRYPTLPTVSQRWSREGISDVDYALYSRVLDSLHSLGRASLLTEVWIGLLPLINVARTGWTLEQMLSKLEELANPLIRSESGQPLNPFRMARLVLRLVEAIEPESDLRLGPSRKYAFKLLVEHPRLHKFDWLWRQEREFDKDGQEIHNDDENSCAEAPLEKNIHIICNLWKSSWGLKRRIESLMDGETLSLPTLIGVTKLVKKVRRPITLELLKMVISRFVSDRTPPLNEEELRSKYLKNPKVKLKDEERTRLIEAHMVIGGELGRKFIYELFESFLDEKVIPSVEDMKLLNRYLISIDEFKGKKIWQEYCMRYNGLPWNPSIDELGWNNQQKIEIGYNVFKSLRQMKVQQKKLDK